MMRKMNHRLAKKSEPCAHLRLCLIGPKLLKRRIETGWHRLKHAGGFHPGGEIDGRAFFDL